MEEAWLFTHCRISLLIIGEGNNKKIINEFISNNNLEKSVKLKDYTKNPFPYIKQADLLILTSKFEGIFTILSPNSVKFSFN